MYTEEVRRGKVINIPKAPRDQLQQSSTVAAIYLDKKSNESFVTPACSKDLSSVIMGWMDLVKTIKY